LQLAKRVISLALVITMVFSCNLATFAEDGGPPEGMARVREICGRAAISVGIDPTTNETLLAQEGLTFAVRIINGEMAALYDGFQESPSVAWVIYKGEAYVIEDDFLWILSTLGFTFINPPGTVAVRTICDRYGIGVDFSHEAGASLTHNGITVTWERIDEENAVLSNGSKTAGPILMVLLPGRHYAYEAEFLAALSELGFLLDVENPAGGTSFTVNKNSVVTGGAFMARAEYALPSGYAAAGDGYAVAVSIPAGCSLVPGSVTLDGATAPYEAISSGFSVRSGNRNGIVRFYAAADADGTHIISAQVIASAPYSIGSALVNAQSITINVPEKTSLSAFAISGTASPGGTVSVYDNGAHAGSVAANMVGSWRLPYELINPSAYEEHEFYAEVDASGIKAASERVKMIYSADFVEVARIIMTHNGADTVFDPSQLGIAPHFTYNPDNPEFRFAVEFARQSSRAYGVTVVTTSADGREIRIPASYDPDSGAWVGTRDFTVAEAPFYVRAEYETAAFIDSSLLEPGEDIFLSLFGNAIYSGDDITAGDLAFGRSYPANVGLRGNKGLLGAGWIAPYDARACVAQTDAGGVVLVFMGGGVYVFSDQGNGDYKEKFLGDDVARVEGGKITVATKNGTLIAFGVNGRLESIADANGNSVLLTYNGDQLASIADGFGSAIELSYEGGKVSRATSASTDDTAAYQYDGDNLVSVTGKYGKVSYTYTQAAGAPALETVSTPTGAVMAFAYDDLGRIVSRSLNDGSGVYFSYAGNAVIITDEMGGETVAEFSGGQLSRIENPDGSAREFSYLDGLLLSGITYDSGGLFGMSYDSAHNLTGIFDREGGTVRFSYDGLGNITGVTDRRGVKTEYERDGNGNNTEIRYADGGTQRFSYGAGGLLRESVNQSGLNARYTYDGKGNIARIDYSDGTAASYTYDNRSNVTSVTIDGETTTLTYSAEGNLTGVAYPGGRSVHYAYDDFGRTTSVMLPEGAANYQYDSLNRIIRITDGSNGLIAEYDYAPDGRVSRQANANGTVTDYKYEHGRVSSIRTTSGAGLEVVSETASGAGLAVISEFSYTYNSDGFVESMTEMGEGEWQYAYDGLGQLVRAVAPDGTTTEYEYDLSGNRVSVATDGNTAHYWADNMNRYVSISERDFAYDRSGNLISESGANGVQYEYDKLNRLVRVQTEEDVFEYGYDAFGNRDSVTVNGETTRYLYSPLGLGHPLAEYKPDGTATRFIQGEDGLVAQETGGETYFYAYNHLGSTVAVTGSDGGVANSYRYDQEGRVTQRSESISNPFTYVGRYGVADDKNGLYYMRARYMSQDMGRFISQDPSGQESDLNLYRYAANNYMNYVDLTGASITPVEPVWRVLAPYWKVIKDQIDKLKKKDKDDDDKKGGGPKGPPVLEGLNTGPETDVFEESSDNLNQSITALGVLGCIGILIALPKRVAVPVGVIAVVVLIVSPVHAKTKTPNFPVVPLPDPSGFVYEAVASNRLPGVTVTAFSGGSGSPSKWDAEQYDQANPLTTDENGLYAWDVPFGQWQVKAEKAGYETACSEWLPVPPPQTEVNIGMVSKAAPRVLEVKAFEYFIRITFDKYMDISTLEKEAVWMTGYSGDIDLAFPNAEADPANPDAVYASVVRIVPRAGTFPRGASLNVYVAAGAKSYAGVPMGGGYKDSVAVPGESDAGTLTPDTQPPAGSGPFWEAPLLSTEQPAPELQPYKPLSPDGKDAWKRAADALYALGLLAGTGTDALGKPVYELDKNLSRMEALAFVIRLMGKEKASQDFTGPNPFTDTPDWGNRYAAYAFSVGLTVGVNSEHTLFDPGRRVTAQEFSAFLLRVLKYYERDDDFAFADSVSKASSVGVLPSAAINGGQSVSRGAAAVMMLNALFSLENRSGAKLLDSLVKYSAIAETGARELQEKFQR
jgi:RHS repeat-associated protein